MGKVHRHPAAADPADPLALERDFAWSVYDVNRLIARIFDRRMKELGLTQAQGRVLATVKRQEGISQSQIAHILDMERAPVGKLLDRLEEAGFIERRADTADRRVRRVFVTPKFEHVSDAMQDVGHDIFGVALDGISRKTLAGITEVLMSMKANLMAHETACTGDGGGDEGA